MSASAANEPRSQDRGIASGPDPPRRPSALLQFSLSTLLLVMTLVAVGAALTMAVPPLGGWFIVVGSLALIRTLVECRRFLKDGRELLLGDKLRSYLGSLGHSFLAVVSAMIVFGFLAIFVGGLAGLAQWVAEGLGSRTTATIVASIVGLVLMLGVIAAAGMTFYSVYWKTISPRLTLDPPQPRPTSPDNAAR